MNPIKPVLLAMILVGSVTTQGASFIRVINLSSSYVQAIWQAGGCADVVYDWADERQYTVCDKKMIKPMSEAKYAFGALHSDRSVKVFHQDGEQIAYCNSMDYASVTVRDGEDHAEVEYHCP